MDKAEVIKRCIPYTHGKDGTLSVPEEWVMLLLDITVWVKTLGSPRLAERVLEIANAKSVTPEQIVIEILQSKLLPSELEQREGT